MEMLDKLVLQVINGWIDNQFQKGRRCFNYGFYKL